jgi:hypothetical protein
MFWLTIRQHRMQLVATAGILAVIGVGLLVHAVVTRNAMAGLSGDALDDLLADRVTLIHNLVTWLPAAPALIGIFWGAPVLTREIERGTHLLAWTQSVTRHRWVTTKLAVLAVAVTVSGLVLGVIVTAWQSTFAGTPFAERFSDLGIFAISGVAVGGWWLFAFALGTAAGALTRKMLPAMAITLAVFFVVLFAVFTSRESYAEPERAVVSSQEAGLPGDSMPMGGAWLAPDGTEVDGAAGPCLDVSDAKYLSCMADEGYRSVVYFQPADRYWRFQWTEAAILTAGALLLAGLTYQRVARRAI